MDDDCFGLSDESLGCFHRDDHILLFSIYLGMPIQQPVQHNQIYRGVFLVADFLGYTPEVLQFAPEHGVFPKRKGSSSNHHFSEANC